MLPVRALVGDVDPLHGHGGVRDERFPRLVLLAERRRQLGRVLQRAARTSPGSAPPPTASPRTLRISKSKSGLSEKAISAELGHAQKR